MKKFFLANIPAAAGLLLLVWIVSLGSPAIAAENGMLENFQALFLGSGFLALVIGVPKWRQRADGWIGLFMSIGLLTMLLREIEFDRFNLPHLLVSLGDGTGRDTLLILLWLVLLAGAIRHRAWFPGWLRQGLTSPWGWSLLLGGTFYILGSIFDQKIFPLANSTQQLWEEALETPAALWTTLAALRWLRGNHRPTSLKGQEK